MIHEQRDRGAMSRGRLPVQHSDTVLLPAVRRGNLVDVVVELDEEERLVLHIREEVVLADEVEDAWSAEFEEVGEGFPGLSVQDESELKRLCKEGNK